MRRLRGELWPAQSQQGLHIPQGLLDYAGLDGKIQILASDGKIQIVLADDPEKKAEELTWHPKQSHGKIPRSSLLLRLLGTCDSIWTDEGTWNLLPSTM